MKAFNKIRYKTVEAKRLKNYTIYAIGEIVLVILGILIALGINNWNQNKQLKNANIELQEKALQQLDKDILALEDFKQELDTLNQTYLKVLERDYDSNKVNASGVISTVLFEVNALGLDQQFISLVDNANLDDSAASKMLIDLNSTYKRYIKDVDDVDDIIFQRVLDNLAVIEKTQEWYTELMTDLTCRNDCINFLLKDKGHKSRIASLRFLYVSGYGYIIDGFHGELLAGKADLEAAISKSE